MERELRSLIQGRRIGGGVSRTVYEYKLDPTLVVKIEEDETQTGMWQNVTEWLTWQNNQWCADHARWLAPCLSISRNGRIMIQRRTQLIRVEELPTEIPGFLTDLSMHNWGLLEGRPVVHDYGYNLLLAPKLELKKISWNPDRTVPFGDVVAVEESDDPEPTPPAIKTAEHVLRGTGEPVGKSVPNWKRWFARRRDR